VPIRFALGVAICDPLAFAELALAHVIENKAEAAYPRDDTLEKQRAMREAWAEFVERGWWLTGDRHNATDLVLEHRRQAQARTVSVSERG
jgi:hypothetical protein